MSRKPLLERFGTRVRELRESLPISQEDFAHFVGLNRSYYGEVERGRVNVSLENICRIADGLGVTLSELFEGV